MAVRVDKNGHCNGAMVMQAEAEVKTTERLKPPLASIPEACKYLGGVSRAKFYADILPKLDTIHLGARHFVVVASMDVFIANCANEREHRRCTPSKVGLR